ncbi:MAG: hypothetical protein ABW090_05695 [Sedimenticola sp.]
MAIIQEHEVFAMNKNREVTISIKTRTQLEFADFWNTELAVHSSARQVFLDTLDGLVRKANISEIPGMELLRYCTEKPFDQQNKQYKAIRIYRQQGHFKALDVLLDSTPKGLRSMAILAIAMPVITAMKQHQASSGLPHLVLSASARQEIIEYLQSFESTSSDDDGIEDPNSTEHDEESVSTNDTTEAEKFLLESIKESREAGEPTFDPDLGTFIEFEYVPDDM